MGASCFSNVRSRDQFITIGRLWSDMSFGWINLGSDAAVSFVMVAFVAEENDMLGMVMGVHFVTVCCGRCADSLSQFFVVFDHIARMNRLRDSHACMGMM